MMNSDQKHEATEQTMLQEIWGGEAYCSEDLFWIRYHMGCIYLNTYYPQMAARLNRSRLFWQWYRGIWHLNDLWIKKHKAHYRMQHYKLFQRERFETYKPVPPLIEAALRETEELTV
jgi:hypothetical protein